MCGVASTWTLIESAPASAKAATWCSGRSIIRCTSSQPPASCTWSRSASTMRSPMEIGGTKWPSITSTWMTFAPASITSATCSPSRAKSEARIDGATRMLSRSSRGTPASYPRNTKGPRILPGALRALLRCSPGLPRDAVVLRGLLAVLRGVLLGLRSRTVHPLAVAADGVHQVSGHAVEAGAALDDVALTVAHVETVVALLTVQRVAFDVGRAGHVPAGQGPQ